MIEFQTVPATRNNSDAGLVRVSETFPSEFWVGLAGDAGSPMAWLDRYP